LLQRFLQNFFQNYLQNGESRREKKFFSKYGNNPKNDYRTGKPIKNLEKKIREKNNILMYE